MKLVTPKSKSDLWQFWIDRGGTFTDIVAKTPEGELKTKKLLSENPEAYVDAALHGVRLFLGIEKDAPIPSERVKSIKMGTTVATNALLEKKGDPTLLAITAGLGDILEVGYQARPDTFAMNIKKPELIYDQVIEIAERILPDGRVELALNEDLARKALQSAYDQGLRSIAIVFMHAYKYPQHEQLLADIAKQVGFTQISVSHEVSPLSKIVSRGETTVVDAYLTPILRRYVDRISDALNNGDDAKGRLLFMQSSGGLVDADKFQGRDSILSGPAGGIVGAVHTSKLAGFDKMIGFDMGGTSTDVSHYAGEFERTYETEVAGVRMRVPMMYIHTVAAGGGSLLTYEDDRFRVGPDSAGANPGPVCYRRGGKLAVTDINVCLGKIQPEYFPAIFGPEQNQTLDRNATVAAFNEISALVGDGRSAEDVAEGFLEIAIEHMAQAIKQISVSRGYDVKEYALNCFGGAGGQHACLVAEHLGIKTVLLHPLSGVLSAYGMGLADIRTERQQVVEQTLIPEAVTQSHSYAAQMLRQNTENLIQQGVSEHEIEHDAFALVRYKGTDTTIKIALTDVIHMRESFESHHMQRFGFIAPEKDLIIETVIMESYGGRENQQEGQRIEKSTTEPPVEATRNTYAKGKWHKTPVYKIESLDYGHVLHGPAIVIEPTGTIVIEQNWIGRMSDRCHLILEYQEPKNVSINSKVDLDPVTLEVFNNLYMSIAQQMGIMLQNTSQSVNVKERLDFSCAIFDAQGNLVANAPHVPVHLGSMDSSVKVLIDNNIDIRPGDAFVHNNPYNGGSHLPDVTVISPVFDEDEKCIIFFVASRAHHEDIGGVAPGSMSPTGRTIYEEGIMFDCDKLIDRNTFLTEDIRKILTDARYPARNPDQNIADLMAQAAANTAGADELRKLVVKYGMETVTAYMQYIQDNAEEAVRKVISRLNNGHFTYTLDSGERIVVTINIDKEKREAEIDFTGTGKQLENNFNAPQAITRAAVLYVFRCLVDDDIPLNAGCMKPIKTIVPEGSLLNPRPPAAVVAGNVETSQALTNALFAAIGALGSSQGTMNNLTFGNEKYQYYETICSGSPAGKGFDGVAAVHTHMTNTRLTDPEIMEQRYPVLLQEFCIDRNSGGKGQWNAGDGVRRSIRFLEDMECSILSGHRVVAPYGLYGGETGRLGENSLVRENGETIALGGCTQVKVGNGDVVTICTPTGGGFGSPKERDTE
ncbi:hydantoinase B/oxoprolinase family protein [Agarilytica rhodophyticola]|uniref:hydantoinase B/oxoprolinase family protein n=1 Tax=Agarilytica rhodophyticola TaxID=1737490 RepID=UPI000B3478D9|nr:hydantoinase B/oxoprolinase family protein [Agarilytica rhodophyticola]